MPISRKQFEKGDFNVKHTDRWLHPISILLRKNIGLAYRVDGIEKHVKLSQEGIRGMLQNLRKMGWIIHKQPYWAWKKGSKEKK